MQVVLYPIFLSENCFPTDLTLFLCKNFESRTRTPALWCYGAGPDPRDGGAGEGLHGEGHVWSLPLGAYPPQVPGPAEDREDLPSIQ